MVPHVEYEAAGTDDVGRIWRCRKRLLRQMPNSPRNLPVVIRATPPHAQGAPGVDPARRTLHQHHPADRQCVYLRQGRSQLSGPLQQHASVGFFLVQNFTARSEIHRLRHGPSTHQRRNGWQRAPPFSRQRPQNDPRPQEAEGTPTGHPELLRRHKHRQSGSLSHVRPGRKRPTRIRGDRGRRGR